MTCHERGYCYGSSGEEDEESTSDYCQSDDDCASGFFCNTAMRICIQECRTATDCGLGLWTCTDRGQCVNLCEGDQDCTGLPDQDVVVEVVDEGVAEVDGDYDVPAGYCGPLPPLNDACGQTGDCRLITSTNRCDCRAVGPQETRDSYVQYALINNVCEINPSVCTTPPCDGDVLCLNNHCVLLPPVGDQDNDVDAQRCSADYMCPAHFYCYLAEGYCKQDCVVAEDCGDPRQFYCNDIGRCLPLDPDQPNYCETDQNCDYGQYCDSLGVCAHDCNGNADCPDGQICEVPKGRCMVPGGGR